MKKVLIISHLPLSTTTNVGKTLYNLFNEYPSANLCQIFFTNQGRRCDDVPKFFLSDASIVKSIWGAKGICGRAIRPDEVVADTSIARRNTKIDLRSPSALLFRDVCWKMSHYYNKGLQSWIESMNADVIFLAPGYSAFAYDLAVRIANDFRIPLFLYFMEDFYDEKHISVSPFYWIRKWSFREAVRKAVASSTKVYALNEGLAKEYENTFKRPIHVLFNPVVHIVNPENTSIQAFPGIVRILYAGSIGFDRITVLETVAESIERLCGKIRLLICGACKSDGIITRITRFEHTEYLGILNHDELQVLISEVDALLHVESFEVRYVAKTRLALSTKIPEYLGAGKLIIAIGPKELESNDYLCRNNAAIVITDMNAINDFFVAMIHSSGENLQIVRNANCLAIKNHSAARIRPRLYNDLNQGEYGE